MPSSVRDEIEKPTISSTQAAAIIFQEQCATQNTGCALQARFLKNVVDKYQTMKSHAKKIPAQQHVRVPEAFHQIATDPTTQAAHSLTSLVYGPPQTMAATNMPIQNQGVGYQVDFGNYAFTDNEIWEPMFADAGFRINEGQFMPDDRR